MSGSWAFQETGFSVNLGLWADIQENGPLAGSHLLTFTNGGCYLEAGGMVSPIPGKNAEGPPQRKKEAVEASSFCLPEEAGTAQRKTKLFWSLFSTLKHSTFVILSPLFWDDINRKAQYGRHLWFQIRKWSETEQKVWVPPTAGFRGTEPMNIVRNSSFRRDKVKLGISERKGKWKKMSLTQDRSTEVRPKPEL